MIPKSIRTVAARIATAVLVSTLVFAAGCGAKMVKVTTGTKVVCTYGETVSSTVRTLEVPADKAGDYKVVVKTVVCAKHRALEALYAAAQKAITAGDLALAASKLKEVIALQPDFRKAADQAAEIAAGKTPKPDTGTAGGGSTTPTSTTTPEGPVASLSKWVPDSIPGYKADPVIADAAALTREYVPTSSGAVSSLVIVAEQFRTEAAAKAAAADTIARQYPASRATLTVEGRTLQFGMNGTKFGAVAWNEGAIVVVVEGYAPSGTAASVKQALQTVAAALIP